MADKRVCGICTEHGHTSVECPRRIGARKPLIRGAPALVGRGMVTKTVGSIPDVIYIVPDAPSCPYCEGYRVEIAMLKRRLAERVAESVTTSTDSDTENPPGVTDNEGAVTVNRRGRPNSGNALTPAQKQRAYRERHGSHQDD